MNCNTTHYRANSSSVPGDPTFPERCIAAHLRLAREHGAALRLGERVTGWDPAPDAVRITTEAHAYEAGHVVLAAGAWMPELLAPRGGPAGFALPLAVERQVLHWFEPAARAGEFAPDRCPVYLWEYEPDRFFYGFPDFGDGVKVALHHGGERPAGGADAVRREVDAREADAMRALLGRLIPDAAGRLLESTVCLYTDTPDTHFVIDAHPDDPRVTVVSACSGHGFKFASAIGELLADLATGAPTPFDLSPFRAGRFAGASA